MQGSIDLTGSLGKFPLSKILFCALVMFRWADCELDCEKPDHRSSDQYDEPTLARRTQFGRPDFFKLPLCTIVRI